jgi:small subunit ribosomal protein S23
VQGLLKSGAMKYEDRPIFYEIYKAFPPLKEPQFHDKVDPNIKIRPIFYAEDEQRA